MQCKIYNHETIVVINIEHNISKQTFQLIANQCIPIFHIG